MNENTGGGMQLTDVQYMCRVCGYDAGVAASFEYWEICDCCGYMVGLAWELDNISAALRCRRDWIAAGCPWGGILAPGEVLSSWERAPEGWDVGKQLARIPAPYRRGLSAVDTPGEVWARTGPPLGKLVRHELWFPAGNGEVPDSRFVCRVCGQAYTEFMPWGENEDTPSWQMCDSCGVEFGHEDATLTGIRYYRVCWEEAWRPWFNGRLPDVLNGMWDGTPHPVRLAQRSHIPERYR